MIGIVCKDILLFKLWINENLNFDNLEFENGKLVGYKQISKEDDVHGYYFNGVIVPDFGVGNAVDNDLIDAALRRVKPLYSTRLRQE